MKGTLLGLLFGTEGIATGFASAFIALQDLAPEFSFFSFFGNSNFFYNDIPKYKDCIDELQHESGNGVCHDSPLFSYIAFLVIAVISVIGFIVAAVCYKFRKRDPEQYIPFWFGVDIKRRCCGGFSCCCS